VIEIKIDEPGFLCVGLRNRPQEPLEIIKSPLSKKIRLESTDTPHPSCFAEEISDDESSENVDNDIEFLIKQTPIVVDKPRELGMIELWKTFYTMLSNGTFPVDNIAFLLFLDVVKWYGMSNTLAMRYDETVCKFWRVGYKLFHGKFLRFMSGPKNKGQPIFGQSKKSEFDPSDSKINFAVPYKRIRGTSDGPISPDILSPGIISYLLDKIASMDNKNKTFKLCLDGKKINASTSGSGGDVDLFGFELSPTLAERQNRLKNEIDTVKEAETALSQYIEDSFPGTDVLCEKIRPLIQLLSQRVCDLRNVKVTKQAFLQKFKGIAGSDWKKSKLCIVISAISTQLHDVNSCISTCVDLIDRLRLVCATLNKSEFLFSTSNVIDLKHQANYIHLSETSRPSMPEMTDEENMMDCPIDRESFRTVKQKSHLWYQVRSKATVTGSTLFAALGLDTLKKQTEQFDFVRFKKQKPQEVNEDVRKRMTHGIDNEINAVATIGIEIPPRILSGFIVCRRGFLLGYAQRRIHSCQPGWVLLHNGLGTETWD
jgi:hypothetical protein